MRIAFIVGTFPSLSETFILNQITGLLDQGHTLCIFAGSRSDDVIMHEDVIRSGLLKHTRYHNDKPEAKWLRVLKFLWLFPLNVWRAPTVFFRSINFFRFGREATSLNLFYKALVFLEARDFDVVMCHFGQNGVIGLQMKEIGALKGKLVTAFHAVDITAYVWKQGRAVYKNLFEKGDMFLPISRHAKGKLLELGCPEEKIFIHRMGVDLTQFTLLTRRKFGSLPIRLLSVSRMVEKKGVRYTLEALALLLKKGVAFEYTLIGDGPLRGELESLARTLGVIGRVRFMGWQDSGMVRRSLKDCDLLLSPSITARNGDEEGIPVVLMEALAARVPVISTPSGGIRELVVDGKTGFLVEEKNAAALADKITYLSQHPEVLESVSAQGRRLIEEEYNVSSLNQLLIQLLSAVVYERSES